jgi:hypothetical protein
VVLASILYLYGKKTGINLKKNISKFKVHRSEKGCICSFILPNQKAFLVPHQDNFASLQH